MKPIKKPFNINDYIPKPGPKPRPKPVVYKKSKLSNVPMGIPWEPIVNGAIAVGKAVYNHPEVQKWWKGVKEKHNLNWLPFGSGHLARLRKKGIEVPAHILAILKKHKNGK